MKVLEQAMPGDPRHTRIAEMVRKMTDALKTCVQSESDPEFATLMVSALVYTAATTVHMCHGTKEELLSSVEHTFDHIAQQGVSREKRASA